MSAIAEAADAPPNSMVGRHQNEGRKTPLPIGISASESTLSQGSGAKAAPRQPAAHRARPSTGFYKITFHGTGNAAGSGYYKAVIVPVEPKDLIQAALVTP
jgi:hypothetical protein